MEANTAQKTGQRILARNVGDKSYFESFSEYIHDILPFPPRISKNITGNSTSQNGEDSEKVVWVKFEEADSLSAVQTQPVSLASYVIIGYALGFQVWDINSSNYAQEIFSKRSGIVKLATFLQTPLHKFSPDGVISDKFSDSRPLLGILSGDHASQEFPPSVVKIFSLRTLMPVHTLRFKSTVHYILSNRDSIVVALEGSIFVFDALTLQNTWVINDCYVGKDLKSRNMPSLNPDDLFSISGNINPCSLGSRWLAYAGSEQAIDICQNGDFDTNSGGSSTSYMEIATGVAKDIASGLYYLGDKGMKTVSNYLTDSHASSKGRVASASCAMSSDPNQNIIFDCPENPGKENPIAGVIVVKDLKTGQNIVSFKAHSQHAVSYLQFDPSGQLVAMSSTQGRNFYIFHIIPPNPQMGLTQNSAQKAPREYRVRMLYKLQRGITNAILQSVAFSQDSRWVAFSSIRGTTHVYAINPSGGIVDYESHSAVAVRNSTNDQDASSGIDGILSRYPKLVTLQAAIRIKQSHHDEESGNSFTPVAVSFCAQDVIEKQDGQLLSIQPMRIISSGGVVVQHDLTPVNSNSVNPSETPTLQVNYKALLEWNLRRKLSCHEFVCPFSVLKPPTSSFASKTLAPDLWLSFVEISTNIPPFRPLWMGPQFSFQEYGKEENVKSNFQQSILEDASTQDLKEALKSPPSQSKSSKKKKKKQSKEAQPSSPSPDPPTEVDFSTPETF